MREHEHKTMRCTNPGCGQLFCPECDVPSGAAPVMTMEPVLCGVCLDMTASMTARVTITHIREMFEHIDRGNEL